MNKNYCLHKLKLEQRISQGLTTSPPKDDCYTCKEENMSAILCSDYKDIYHSRVYKGEKSN